MNRSSTVSQNVRFFVAAAALAVGVTACGGGSSTPSGAAGSGGGGSGAAGTSGTACSLADVTKIITYSASPANTGCTLTGACHDAMGSAAGLSFAVTGWQDQLVGKGPTSADAGITPYKSLCSGMNLTYLNAGSNPATGLVIDKIDPSKPTPPCGAHMPNLPPTLTTAQFNCMVSYFTTLTAP